MKANRIYQFGAVETLSVMDVDRPLPGRGEVLVRVEAAGAGPWDTWIRAGNSVLPQPLPLTLGSDLSGVVEMLGPGVDSFHVGESVFGVTNAQFTGAQAQYAVADTARLVRKPATLSHIDAASAPVVAVTAWQMLFKHAQPAPGARVLIHGAAGNVGAYAVQMAHRAGFKVIATASRDDGQHVRELGADLVLDYREPWIDALGGAVDVVLDPVGRAVQRPSFAALKRGGMLISAVSEPDATLAFQQGVRALFILVDVNAASLAPIAAALERGEIRAEVGAVVPLGRAREVHEMLEGLRPRPRGKIVFAPHRVERH